jgi:hypothetical protein
MMSTAQINLELLTDTICTEVLSAIDKEFRDATGNDAIHGWLDQELPALLPAIRAHVMTASKRISAASDITFVEG